MNYNTYKYIYAYTYMHDSAPHASAKISAPHTLHKKYTQYSACASKAPASIKCAKSSQQR